MTNNKNNTLTFFLITAAAVVLIAGLKSAADVLVPFLLSVFIAVISLPPLHWLQNKGLPRWLALCTIILVIIAASTLFATLLGTSVNDFTRSLPEYKTRLQNEIQVIGDFLGKYGATTPSEIIKEYVNPGAAMEVVSKLLNGLNNALANAFFILLTVIFILTEADAFSNKLKRAFSKESANSHLQSFQQFSGKLQQYMAIKTIISGITGLLATLLTWSLGIDYPLLWGMLALLLNYIPTIGSIIAAVPAVLLAFLQIGGLEALFCALGYMTINIVMGNVIEPKYMGKGLGLSTLVVFLSLIFWGWIFGPVGMLLSIPLTMFVKIALDSREDTRWLSVLMDSE